MRIGASIFFKNTVAMQSYGWSTHRVLGRLDGIYRSLDEYECDEIALVRIVKGSDGFDDFIRDLDVVEKCQTSSPLSFGGGLRSIGHVKAIQNYSVERLIFSSMAVQSRFDLLEAAASIFGRQAVQVLLPLARRNETFVVYDSAANTYRDLSDLDFKNLEVFSNELIVYDTDHDGYEDRFDFELLSAIDFPFPRLIVSGGIGKTSIQEAKQKNLASCIVENRVLHKEYSVQEMKKNA